MTETLKPLLLSVSLIAMPTFNVGRADDFVIDEKTDEVVVKALEDQWITQCVAAERTLKHAKKRNDKTTAKSEVTRLRSGGCPTVAPFMFRDKSGTTIRRIHTKPGSEFSEGRFRAVPISIIDDTSILISLEPLEKVTKPLQIVLVDWDTTRIVSDQDNVELSGWFVDLPPRRFDTVIGDSRVYTTCRPIPNDTFERLWSAHFSEHKTRLLAAVDVAKKQKPKPPFGP